MLEFKGSWDVHLPLVEFSYNNSYHTSIQCAPFEALYGRKCRSPLCWLESGERSWVELPIIQETTDKLKFQVGDKVLLKVSPWKGTVRFGKRGKLGPLYIGPNEIVQRIGPVAYKMELPPELGNVHNTFHVSVLKKCLADVPTVVPVSDVRISDDLQIIEEPIEIMDRSVKQLRQSCVPLVRVRWRSRNGHEFTWEREDFMKEKYLQRFQ